MQSAIEAAPTRGHPAGRTVENIRAATKHGARAMLVYGGLMLGSACAPPSTGGRTSQTSPAKSATPALDLESADADVWAWEVPLSAKIIGSARLENCAVEVNGAPQPAVVENGRMTARIVLAPGDNDVAARCSSDRGHLRSKVVRYAARLIDRPRAEVRATIAEGTILLDGTSSRPGPYAHAPLAHWQWTSRPGLDRTSVRALGEGSTLTMSLPGAGEHHYRLRVTDANQQSDETGVVVKVSDGHAAIIPGPAEPSFLEDTVLYGIVPPLYGSPPLRAAAQALGSIAGLGATAVWVSPVFGTLPGDFGYAVTDFEHVRADYGTDEDLQAFVTEAHRKNLRVLLDFVPNHTSREHPYFRQAELLGPRSHYFDFFERDRQGRATHYFDWEHLPNLSYDDREVGRWMTEVATAWVRAFDADGYRVDAAWGVARRNPEYWPQWSAELRHAEPELALFAEAPARDRYYASHGFDAAYDWGDELGQWAWKDVFTSEEGVAARLEEAVIRTAELAARPDRVLRFLNNNDTGPRFITHHGEDMTRVATAALLTLPGIPCIYMFDEVGGEFDPYAGLHPIRPPPRPALREFHEKLVRLRHEIPALHGPDFTPLPLDRAKEVFAYLRRGARAGEIALVLLHFGAAPTSVRASLPRDFSKVRNLRDLLAQRSLRMRAGKLDVRMGPWEVLILVPE